MQTDSKSAIFFLSFDMYLNGKRVEKLVELTVFINCLKFSAHQTRLLPVY